MCRDLKKHFLRDQRAPIPKFTNYVSGAKVIFSFLIFFYFLAARHIVCGNQKATQTFFAVWYRDFCDCLPCKKSRLFFRFPQTILSAGYGFVPFKNSCFTVRICGKVRDRHVKLTVKKECCDFLVKGPKS